MGWYMLAIAILSPSPISIEDAENLFYTGRKSGKASGGRKANKELNEEMLKMREQGMTYGAIAEMYGMKMHAAFKRIQRAKERMAM